MANESAYFIVNSIDSKHSVKELKRELDTLHGVSSVSVNAGKNLVAVDYDSSGTSYDAIEHKLNEIGFEIAADARQSEKGLPPAIHRQQALPAA